MIFTARLPIALLICTLIFACAKKKELPLSPDPISADSLISPDKMILIMSDVHVIEAALLLDRNEGRETKDKPGYFYTGIFRKYHISPERYDQNLLFYRQDQEKFALMYVKVVDLIENRQKKFPRPK